MSEAVEPGAVARAEGVADFDVVVIGAGPAGLSAALNLVRARRRVLVLDSNRPRNAATLRSRGFLTRDGMPPLELRRLGREELERYADAMVVSARVERVVRIDGAVECGEGGGAAAGSREAGEGGGANLLQPDAGRTGSFRVEAVGVRGGPDVTASARAVVIATGLTETLPPLPSIRVYYGTHLHSCIDCDAFEKSGMPLALIGETGDLAERALLLSQWTRDLIVFTNGVAVIADRDETVLASLGITVERRPIVDVTGERDRMTGVALEGGTVIPRVGGFVRPVWSASLGFADGLGLRVDAAGLLSVDDCGRTSLRGVYAAGDITQPGPRQLIVAAGAGAGVAAGVNRDLIARSIGVCDGAPTRVLAPPVQ